MTGHNVLHTMGYDAFGLPAEQYAVQTGSTPGSPPRPTSPTCAASCGASGLGHDPRRSVATTDPAFYRWTQWIFLQIFDSWYDAEADRARPDRRAGGRARRRHPRARPTAPTRRPAVGRARPTSSDAQSSTPTASPTSHEAPVNWCPGLGTVLANEEVTADGRTERGNFPVFRRPLKQWMMRITAYADRLLDDLDLLDWPESHQADAAQLDRPQRGRRGRASRTDGRTPSPVFTTRPDTLFGATYMVLAPEHPLVDELIGRRLARRRRPALDRRRRHPRRGGRRLPRQAAGKSEIERQAEDREKTGVFTGAYATNPVNGEPIPVFVADYVLMGYGTGAIMAVPGQDQRDWDFAEAFGLPDRPHRAAARRLGAARRTPATAPAINTRRSSTAWASPRPRPRSSPGSRSRALGDGHGHLQAARLAVLPPALLGRAVPDRLRRRRPAPRRARGASCRCCCPTSTTSRPARRRRRRHLRARAAAGPAEDWVEVDLDLGDGPQVYRRELNTMPQWAGSCWYELRYLDPTNENAFVDPEVERYWMGPQFEGDCGGVDLYVGGVEHAVLHLLYARFWHKVLFDLGHVAPRSRSSACSTRA